MTITVTTEDYRNGYQDGLKEAARIANKFTKKSAGWSKDAEMGFNKASYDIRDAIESRAKEIRE